MKITTQLTVIICVAIAGLVAMIWFLSDAGWTEGGITGMVTGLGTAIGILIAAVRNQGKQAEQMELLQRALGAGQQTQVAKLDTVVKQTNGMHTAQLEEVAQRAAAAAVAHITVIR
jgi:hypothetical protein